MSYLLNYLDCVDYWVKALWQLFFFFFTIPFITLQCRFFFSLLVLLFDNVIFFKKITFNHDFQVNFNRVEWHNFHKYFVFSVSVEVCYILMFQGHLLYLTIYFICIFKSVVIKLPIVSFSYLFSILQISQPVLSNIGSPSFCVFYFQDSY